MFDAKPDLDIAMANLSQDDSVRKKLALDAVKERLKGDPNKEKELREACEGFESIFINKLWQQMRKSVPKEGFLHSKEEEFYQSMFDQEMSKKIASAGGIGLADILFEQLKQQSELVSRATSPPQPTNPLPIDAETGARPLNAGRVKPVDMDGLPDVKPLVADQALTETKAGSAEDDSEDFLSGLYTPVEEGSGPSAKDEESAHPPYDARIAAGELPEARLIPENMRRYEGPERPAKAAPIEDRTVVANAGSTGAGSPMAAGGQSVGGSAVDSQLSAEESERLRLVASLPVLEPPVDGAVSSPFGWRNDPFTGQRNFHQGVDYQAPQGAPVRACWDGEVVFAGERPGYGNIVVLEHQGGWRSFYGHADGLDVSRGDVVQAGRKIASVGSTGRSTGPHLHFEIRHGGQAFDPEGLRRTMLANSEQGVAGS
ncbi:MAG: peptidoglycan DD-metalloendopeptidase family protein [Oceanidesulfovibrio sp.]